MRKIIDIQKLEQNEFSITYGEICGEKTILVSAKGFPKWNKDTLIYRSSLWTEDGLLISPGFRKFFNWGEAPQIVEEPSNILKCKFLEKLDGSLLIVSKYKGHLIHRTRGTHDASNLDNGFELEDLKNKYPKAFDNKWINSEETTLLFEWLSSNNTIVIKYDNCPDIKLVGAIKHSDYSYYTQNELDMIAKEIGVERPLVYRFPTFKDMVEMVKLFKGKEGVCVYFNNDQDIKKVKGDWYLAAHAFKSDLTLDNLLELYIRTNELEYNDFLKEIEKLFDYECSVMAMPLASKIYDAKRQVESIIEGMNRFLVKVRELPTRKEQALLILSSYGQTNRADYVFTLLDNKPLDEKAKKKLYFQVLKG